MTESIIEQGRGPMRLYMGQQSLKWGRRFNWLMGDTDREWAERFAPLAGPDFQRTAGEIRGSSARRKLGELRSNTIIDPELKRAMIEELESVVQQEPSTARGRSNRPGVALQTPPDAAPVEWSWNPTWTSERHAGKPDTTNIVMEIQKTNQLLQKLVPSRPAADREAQEEANRIARDTNGKLDAMNTNLQVGRRTALAAPGQDPEGR